MIKVYTESVSAHSVRVKLLVMELLRHWQGLKDFTVFWWWYENSPMCAWKASLLSISVKRSSKAFLIYTMDYTFSKENLLWTHCRNCFLSGSPLVFISKRFLQKQDLQPARSSCHWSICHPYPLHKSACRPSGPSLPFQLGKMVKFSLLIMLLHKM